MLTHDYIVFASRFRVPPDAAHVLPALFEKAAGGLGLPTRKLLSMATYDSVELGVHMADLAVTINEELDGD